MLVANCKTERHPELPTIEFKLDFCIRHQYHMKCACLLTTYFTVATSFLGMLTSYCTMCKGRCKKEQITSESSRSLTVRHAFRHEKQTFPPYTIVRDVQVAKYMS